MAAFAATVDETGALEICYKFLYLWWHFISIIRRYVFAVLVAGPASALGSVWREK